MIMGEESTMKKSEMEVTNPTTTWGFAECSTGTLPQERLGIENDDAAGVDIKLHDKFGQV